MPVKPSGKVLRTVMSDFEAQTMQEADRLVVALAGECDLCSRDELVAALQKAVQSASTVIVDLAAVRFLDSSGLHALVAAYQAARARANNLYVVNATGTVATVLNLTGVMELLRHPGDVEEVAVPRPDHSA